MADRIIDMRAVLVRTAHTLACGVLLVSSGSLCKKSAMSGVLTVPPRRAPTRRPTRPAREPAGASALTRGTVSCRVAQLVLAV
jgi:hypothetical protein